MHDTCPNLRITTSGFLGLKTNYSCSCTNTPLDNQYAVYVCNCGHNPYQEGDLKFNYKRCSNYKSFGIRNRQ